jgi:hypothetical protein
MALADVRFLRDGAPKDMFTIVVWVRVTGPMTLTVIWRQRRMLICSNRRRALSSIVEL